MPAPATSPSPPQPRTVSRLAALARVSPDAVAAATLAAFDGTAIDLTGLDPGDRHSYRQVAARGWAPAHATQACPACLGQTGTWLVAWRLLLVTACTRHRAVLAADCPSCRRPLRDQQHSPLRAVGAATTCGNPLGAGPTRQCRRDLTTISTPSVDPDVLRTQARIDIALTGAPATAVGTSVTAREYLADLRHLTTLLLHLAAQPAAADLAHWTGGLTLEAAARTGTRGPRWGLRPPTDPARRGAALATADALLACDTVDEAATALSPWLEATPRTTDGTLDWLADHTVMTATLTRLVTAARAPHRRLSRHLDTRQENEGAMPAPLHTIPQVMPSRMFRDHLADAFDSGEHTVRLFASLCLARTHTEVTTWADAAVALGLPAELGHPPPGPARPRCGSATRRGLPGSMTPSPSCPGATTGPSKLRSANCRTGAGGSKPGRTSTDPAPDAPAASWPSLGSGSTAPTDTSKPPQDGRASPPRRTAARPTGSSRSP